MYDDASTPPQARYNGIVRPYALAFPRRAARRAYDRLSSGSGAGDRQQSRTLLRFTIVEINPGYLALVARGAEVMSVLTNPRFKRSPTRPALAALIRAGSSTPSSPTPLGTSGAT